MASSSHTIIRDFGKYPPVLYSLLAREDLEGFCSVPFPSAIFKRRPRCACEGQRGALAGPSRSLSLSLSRSLSRSFLYPSARSHGPTPAVRCGGELPGRLRPRNAPHLHQREAGAMAWPSPEPHRAVCSRPFTAVFRLPCKPPATASPLTSPASSQRTRKRCCPISRAERNAT
jgi:hypothetical protein